MAKDDSRNSAVSDPTWERCTVYRSRCGCYMVMKECKERDAPWHVYVGDDGTWHSVGMWTAYATSQDAMDSIADRIGDAE